MHVILRNEGPHKKLDKDKHTKSSTKRCGITLWSFLCGPSFVRMTNFVELLCGITLRSYLCGPSFLRMTNFVELLCGITLLSCLCGSSFLGMTNLTLQDDKLCGNMD
jgi:hypothetical protein